MNDASQDLHQGSEVDPRRTEECPKIDREGAPPAKHPSMEKTDRNLGAQLAGLREPAFTDSGKEVSESINSADLSALRDEIEQKQRECSNLTAHVADLRAEIDTLRNDFSVQKAEQNAEIQTLKELLEKEKVELAEVEREIDELEQNNKALKSQNLSLQYHLNAWGIPVLLDDDSERELEGVNAEGRSFFPSVIPLEDGDDPVPVVLRGDLASLPFPNLLNFLANSHVSGVVTVVAEGVVAKLCIERNYLTLAGWNDADPEIQLLALLREAEIVSQDLGDELDRADLYDLDLAERLLAEDLVPLDTIQQCLKEHTRIILSYLFELNHGAFFFQPGQIRDSDLHFYLSITDILLKTAAAADERARESQVL